MARSPTPSRAAATLVEELKAQGCAVSSRRLEDWARIGLIPRGTRRWLGRGRGSETVYPPDMVDSCRMVAERMRRGQPWQVVALIIFAKGIDLPEATVRAAYRWAFSVEVPEGEDELSVAEGLTTKALQSSAGRRLARAVAGSLKNSGSVRDETLAWVAQSVLTNLILVAVGGEPASDDAILEMFAGVGFPVGELPTHERRELADFADVVLEAFSFEKLRSVAEETPIEDLRQVMPTAAKAFELFPQEIGRVLPPILSEYLPALLAPLLIQARRVADELGLVDRVPA